MLSADRAREIKKKASRFPYWGSYSKFMTADEEAHVMQLFRDDPDGGITVATVVHRISVSDTPQPVEGK